MNKAAPILRRHGYSMKPSDYLSTVRSIRRRTKAHVCEYGHDNCALKKSGPCFDEIKTINDQYRR